MIMIILLGPDESGKTTLAKKLEARGLKYYHFTQDSGYTDYLPSLCKLEFTNAVLDRHAICEYPYSICMNRQFKFTLKHWHNLLTMTLIQNPLIILCTHKPAPAEYKRDQYLPYTLWDECMRLYREFLNSHNILHTEYDYTINTNIEYYIQLATTFSNSMEWWRKHWSAGYGCAGSSNPKFLLVAERIGPNNMNNIPFETGPTGFMLSNMLYSTGTPLGKLAVTNMVKSFRKDTRKVNDKDVELLREEIIHLKPKKVIFMGTPARQGIPTAHEFGCETDTIVHLGSLRYSGVKDMTGYNNEWRKMTGLVPTVKFE